MGGEIGVQQQPWARAAFLVHRALPGPVKAENPGRPRPSRPRFFLAGLPAPAPAGFLDAQLREWGFECALLEPGPAALEQLRAAFPAPGPGPILVFSGAASLPPELVRFLQEVRREPALASLRLARLLATRLLMAPNS